jgi:hypothetical protein
MPDQARFEPLEESKNFRPTQLTADDRASLCIDAMHLKDGLGQIEADGDR